MPDPTIKMEGASKAIDIQDVVKHFSHTTWLGRAISTITLLLDNKGWLTKDSLIETLKTAGKSNRTFLKATIEKISEKTKSKKLDNKTKRELINLKNELTDIKTETTSKGKISYLTFKT